MLDLNERTCVLKEREIQSDTLKNDQFGAWLKNQTCERVKTIDGRAMGRKVARTTKSWLHLDNEADLTKIQQGTGKVFHYGLDQK